MQALKALVAGMGLLIILGSAVLVWGLYQKANNPDFRLFSGFTAATEAPRAAEPAKPGAPTAPMAFSSSDLGLSQECGIADMQIASGELFIRVNGGAGCDRIVVVNPADGHILGTIKARP